MGSSRSADLKEIYRRLYSAFGPQRWWPARTPFEVMVGAILTQNTNWKNVEKAITNLRSNRLLTPQAIEAVSVKRLARFIRPAGYFNVKARRLKDYVRFFIDEFNGQVPRMKKENPAKLRTKLLAVKGIGPETADSILLYALDFPVFVVDAYTRRFLFRHNMIDSKAGYEEIQRLFMKHLEPQKRLFNEYHALIVQLGKEFCRPQAACECCPLRDFKYSLTFKCRSCHRALPRLEERFPANKNRKNQIRQELQLLCHECA